MSFKSPFIPNRFHGIKFSIFRPKSLRLLFDISKYCHPTEHRKSLRMFFRSLYWAKLSIDWYQQIACSSLLSELVNLERNLPEKLHRQILRTDLPIEKRLKILTEHYAVIEQLIAPSLLQKALLNGGLLLSTIEINPEHRFLLTLGYGIYPGKEGELSITMHDLSSHALLRLCFTIIPNASGNLIYIGGLQGANCENSRIVVGEASKACHGLAPRRIVMEALFALAKHIDAAAILGVSDKQHISSKKLTKHFNYDAYWADFDAVRNDNGDYDLPLVPTHKDYADTSTKRRAKYRRQHAILNTVNSDTLRALVN